MVKFFFHLLVFFVLTVLTQVGGVIYLLCLFITKQFGLRGIKRISTFLLIYLLNVFLIIPILSGFGDRKALPIFGDLRPISWFTVLCNRHYVTEALEEVALEMSNQMVKNFPGTKTNYLDANFPFWDGFPLFPHLSHSDGKKLDLAFYYKKDNKFSSSTPTLIGYGSYENPEIGESDYPRICKERGFWQYGLIGKLVPASSSLELDNERTKFALIKLSTDSRVSKIFIEPHLKDRWGLSGFEKIRFHGCQAVRHDDHIHFQID
ncbi:hypothetical protein [Ekhidna sp.]|uniref:hypothetical protein n=1 Tax=Ekhidna sp. TaxID=2608089 RepID=UPI003C7C8116